MLQVTGGMDRLPEALAVRLDNRIVYRAAVREICQSERGVWVIYADAKGQTHRVDADYCVSTIPLPVLHLRAKLRAINAQNTIENQGTPETREQDE
jgi:monoamine oxidase